MRYSQFGRTGLAVSKIALGAMVFGWKTPAQDAFRIIDRALDEGVNLIDTSNSYGRGHSEEVVGEALARNGRRDATILATKVHYRMDESDNNSVGNGRRNVIHACEASLRRLRTDRIDLYQIHMPQPDITIEETLGALDDLARAGKIVHAGSCNFAAWQIIDAKWAAKTRCLAGFKSEQAPYNLLDRSIEVDLLPAARSNDIAVMVYSPLAEGILTGKYRRGQPLPATSRYAKIDKPGLHRERLTGRVFDVVEELERLSGRRGWSLSTYALAWLLSRPDTSSVIVGPSTEEQLTANLTSLDAILTEAECREIDAITMPGSTTSPFNQTTLRMGIRSARG